MTVGGRGSTFWVYQSLLKLKSLSSVGGTGRHRTLKMSRLTAMTVRSGHGAPIAIQVMPRVPDAQAGLLIQPCVVQLDGGVPLRFNPPSTISQRG